jgi:hypothetical protein
MKPVHLLLLHEGEHCAPCRYMSKVIASVVPEFGEAVLVERVVIRDSQGALRYGEISKTLGRPAPVPSIFVDGELVFDRTPSREDLQAFLRQRIHE